MSVRIEIGKGWVCTLVGAETRQDLATRFKQPIILRDIEQFRSVQLWQGIAVVNLYFEDQMVKLESWNWAKSRIPTTSTGLVVKWDKYSSRRTQNLRIQKYTLIGEDSSTEFGEPSDRDYLKVSNQSLDRAILLSCIEEEYDRKI